MNQNYLDSIKTFKIYSNNKLYCDSLKDESTVRFSLI